jgi:MFS family permease
MKKIHYAWWIMLACCLLNVGVLGIISYSAGIFFQPVVKELGISTGAMGMYVTIRSLAMAASMPLVGRILPRKSIGKILAAAACVCFGSYGLMSCFTAIWQWYLIAVVMGISCGFLFFVPTPLLINNWFYKKSGFALGIALMCSGLSGSVWSLVGNYLIEEYGWRAAYAILAIVGAVLVIPAMLILVRWKPEEMGLLPYGMTQEEWETQEEKQTDAKAEKNQEKLGVVLQECGSGKTQFFFVFITCCALSYSASYVQYLPSYAASLGLASSFGAAIASCAMIGSVVWKLGLGWMNDYLGAKRSTILGLCTVAAAFVVLICGSGNLRLLQAAAFFYGAAPAIMAVSPSVIAKCAFGSKSFGKIYSYITIGTSLVAAISASLIGMLYDISGSYISGFLIGIFCCTLAIILLNQALQKNKS